MPKPPPTPTDIIDWLNAEEIIELDWDYPEDGDLFAAGLESATVMQAMVHALEDEYGIELNEQECSRDLVGTPRALATQIAKKLRGQP